MLLKNCSSLPIGHPGHTFKSVKHSWQNCPWLKLLFCHRRAFGKIKRWIWPPIRAKSHILMLFPPEYKRDKMRCFYFPFVASFDRNADKSFKKCRGTPQNYFDAKKSRKIFKSFIGLELKYMSSFTHPNANPYRYAFSTVNEQPKGHCYQWEEQRSQYRKQPVCTNVCVCSSLQSSIQNAGSNKVGRLIWYRETKMEW